MTVIRGSRMHQRPALVLINITGGSTSEGAWRAARSGFAPARRRALQRCRAVRGLRRRTLRGRRRRRSVARWGDGDGRYGRRRGQWAADRRPANRSPSAHRRSRGALPAPSRPGACRHPPRRRSGRHWGTPVTGQGGRLDRLARIRVPRLLPRAAVGGYRSSRSPSVSCASQRLEKDPSRHLHQTHLGVPRPYGRPPGGDARGDAPSSKESVRPFAAGAATRWPLRHISGGGGTNKAESRRQPCDK